MPDIAADDDAFDFDDWYAANAPPAKRKAADDGQEEDSSAGESAASEAGDRAATDDDSDDQEKQKVPRRERLAKKAKVKAEKGKHGVWVGNLTFATTRKELLDFFKNGAGITSITRVNLPQTRPGQNKGFAYVDFETQDDVTAAIKLSEKLLHGRALLIKSSSDFKGRPKKEEAAAAQASKKQPQPTLFVGNLAFDTTAADLHEIFAPHGAIKKVRVATFEDNQQKCKGFALVDFNELASATAAISCRKPVFCHGRKLRVEYASEDATRRGHGKSNKKITNSEGKMHGDGRRPPPKQRQQPWQQQHHNHHIEEKREIEARPMPTRPEDVQEMKRKGVVAEFKGSKMVFSDNDDE